jgi:hypothetical protein
MTRVSMHAVGPMRQIARTLVLSYLAVACSTWRVQLEPTAELAPPTRARISLADSSRIYLRDVRVRSDTLFGRAEGDDSLRMAIPMSAVRKIELQDSNTGHVVAVTGGVLLGAAILGTAIFAYMVSQLH